MHESQLEKYIVLIPNAIEPYGYELVNILSYPSGFQYRFRFQKEWVQDKVQHNISKLGSKKGYILLRDKNTAKFYPIRFCTIKLSRTIGKFYYFEYELGDIIDYDSKENLRIKQIEEFNKNFTEFHKTDLTANAPNTDLTPLCLLSNYEPNIKNQNFSGLSTEREFEQWGNVLLAIKDIKFYEDVEFIRLVDISSIKNEKDKAPVENNSFILTEGKDYVLRIFQYIPQKISEKENTRDIQIHVDENYVVPIRAKQRAVGKYDILAFLIRTKPTSGGKWSFIDVEHVAKAEAQSLIEPRVHFPIFIKKIWKRTLLIFSVTILFFLIYIFPNFVSDFIKLDDRTIKDISIIVISISFIDFLKEIRDYLRE